MSFSKINETHHCFTALGAVKGASKGKLKGISVSVKDGICVKGMQSSAGSAMLTSYQPVFHATAVQKALDVGATIIGKTTQDAFGFGSFCMNVGEGLPIPNNPVDPERVTGGSSGGSACVTALADVPHISLGESTGGSIVCPAAYCGVVGLCPTYGRVSRYGLIDYGNSLDKIGPMAKTVKECALMLEAISGKDEKDFTTADVPVDAYSTYCGKGVKGITIGVVKEALLGATAEVKEAFEKALDVLKEKGAQIKEVSLPLSYTYSLPAYYIIALSEASTNLAKYCGIRYGGSFPLADAYNEQFSKVRTQFFSLEEKRRILLGTFARMSGFREAYYLQAAKVRTKIINEYEAVFKEVDVLVSPTMPNVAPKKSEVEKMDPLEEYQMDVLTTGPNLAGLPHVTVPIGKGLPKGCMIMGKQFDEKTIIQVAHEL